MGYSCIGHLEIPTVENHSAGTHTRGSHHNELVLEYVMAQPHSYCLAIGRDFARIVPLTDRESIESSVIAYLKTLKRKGTSKAQGGDLYATLLREIPEISKKERLVIVPDGRLHLLPFDALVDGSGRYLVSSHTITYALPRLLYT